MLASSLFYGVLAAVATAVTAQTTEGLSTTTSTSTMTRTVTITQCNPSITNCPGRNTSSTTAAAPTTIVSSANLTSAMPTPSKNSTGYVQPTLSPKTSTAGVVLPSTAPQPPVATVPPTAAGTSVFVQSGLMLGVLGAGIAILA
ncbi:hypothetical protein MCOR27_003782 [Pyricularia oryzae]|uniref:GPI anchored serine-rich protein n=5 Tax=Pyricularia TaxID=48558 RepID=A0ABQ8NE44_PYRGI|nr:uncharacterized protein MGG_00539 [Pyricularia oryzae 70-15]ELQ38886.1 hypothetical protein OOU_Y34scaffold00522g41 [Pyricularia oryzae Y34]KAH8840881.1 hypothetical protein MCOR01_007563 [Pyricularia oryzae]KAI6295557.1 hypothetical protein MCOR33_007575 [Pyricularia grisea]EHA48928.1 hypothetical protein MGG_00539 [Pyricularia oryzae 70-15]KAH9433796.1 hypothetical protein MCOR02_005834 [Pyricularia oryzae]